MGYRAKEFALAVCPYDSWNFRDIAFPDRAGNVRAGDVPASEVHAGGPCHPHTSSERDRRNQREVRVGASANSTTSIAAWRGSIHAF
jgi:hypothetical protein